MTDLRAFIEARLAEDELVARATTSPDWREDSAWFADMLDPLPSQRREHPGYIPMITREDIQHIARLDPARVLREVEAKRLILEEHAGYLSSDLADGVPVTVRRCGTCLDTGTDELRVSPCTTLRALALAWSDHPDYRSEWSPENVIPPG